MVFKVSGTVYGVERTKKGTGTIVSVLVTEGESADLLKVYIPDNSDGTIPGNIPKRLAAVKDLLVRASVDLVFAV